MSDDENAREMSRLWRVWKTAKQMCYDRVCALFLESCSSAWLMIVPQGYELTEDEINLSLDDFRSMCSDGSGAAKYVEPVTI